jgi:hypothetical protein
VIEPLRKYAERQALRVQADDERRTTNDEVHLTADE